MPLPILSSYNWFSFVSETETRFFVSCCSVLTYIDPSTGTKHSHTLETNTTVIFPAEALHWVNSSDPSRSRRTIRVTDAENDVVGMRDLSSCTLVPRDIRRSGRFEVVGAERKPGAGIVTGKDLIDTGKDLIDIGVTPVFGNRRTVNGPGDCELSCFLNAECDTWMWNPAPQRSPDAGASRCFLLRNVEGTEIDPVTDLTVSVCPEPNKSG